MSATPLDVAFWALLTMSQCARDDWVRKCFMVLAIVGMALKMAQMYFASA